MQPESSRTVQAARRELRNGFIDWMARGETTQDLERMANDGLRRWKVQSRRSNDRRAALERPDCSGRSGQGSKSGGRQASNPDKSIVFFALGSGEGLR